MIQELGNDEIETRISGMLNREWKEFVDRVVEQE
jgi:hypothetical protein